MSKPRTFYVDGKDVVHRPSGLHAYFDRRDEARRAATVCNASEAWARGYEWFGDGSSPIPLPIPVRTNRSEETR